MARVDITVAPAWCGEDFDRRSHGNCVRGIPSEAIWKTLLQVSRLQRLGI
jgi:hypothetical protein